MESKDRQINSGPAETRPPRKHPIFLSQLHGKSKTSTELVSAKTPEDNVFDVINTTTGKSAPQTSHNIATGYALLNRRDLPRDLSESLRQHHHIKRRKSQKKQHKPPIYTPFEDPPETE